MTPLQKLQMKRAQLAETMHYQIERLKLRPSLNVDQREVVNLLDSFLYLIVEYPEQERNIREITNEKN